MQIHHLEQVSSGGKVGGVGGFFPPQAAALSCLSNNMSLVGLQGPICELPSQCILTQLTVVKVL